MNKSTQREVQKARQFAAIEPRYAAATLATLFNAASKAVQAELIAVVDELKLRGHLDVVNGCFAAKAAA